MFYLFVKQLYFKFQVLVFWQQRVGDCLNLDWINWNNWFAVFQLEFQVLLVVGKKQDVIFQFFNLSIVLLPLLFCHLFQWPDVILESLSLLCEVLLKRVYLVLKTCNLASQSSFWQVSCVLKLLVLFGVPQVKTLLLIFEVFDCSLRSHLLLFEKLWVHLLLISKFFLHCGFSTFKPKYALLVALDLLQELSFKVCCFVDEPLDLSLLWGYLVPKVIFFLLKVGDVVVLGLNYIVEILDLWLVFLLVVLALHLGRVKDQVKFNNLLLESIDLSLQLSFYFN